MTLDNESSVADVFPVERRRHILEALARNGKVVATELARNLDVSVDTIRRDLNLLAQEGFIQRVHGGALPAARPIESVAERQGRDVDLKQIVARKALSLIQPGQLVIFDEGTTLAEMALAVDPKLRFTVITRNLKAALILVQRTAADVIVLGGPVDRMDLSAGGPQMIREIGNYRVDIFFHGLCALHPDVGLTSRRLDEVELIRAFIQASGTVVGVGVRDKVGAAAPFVIGPATLLDYLVVAPELDAADAAEFRQKGIEVL
jgi:DeoR/GlpR family transcriptional regulator of sugar metabolism